MEFNVSKEVFDVLDNYYLGVVAARGIDNLKPQPKIQNMLNENIALCEQRFEGLKVKETPEMSSYRQAFEKLGINPNKFMPSIEALLTRIAKKKGFPSINALVDLGNSVSLKYCLPIGAHDLGTVQNSLSVRFAEPEDHFIAFGSSEVEAPDAGELVYVSGNEIRTRKWIWRQSEVGKITEQTSSLIFPIDGFLGVNDSEVAAAKGEIETLLKELFGCEVVSGFIDKNHPSFEIEF